MMMISFATRPFSEVEPWNIMEDQNKCKEREFCHSIIEIIFLANSRSTLSFTKIDDSKIWPWMFTNVCRQRDLRRLMAIFSNRTSVVSHILYNSVQKRTKTTKCQRSDRENNYGEARSRENDWIISFAIRQRTQNKQKSSEISNKF